MPTDVRQRHPSIRINTTIGSAVHFVDAYLSHDNGVLNTKVYRYPNTHDNSLPDVPHVSMCPDSHLLRAALIRAVRCCSNVQDFNDEQRRIKLSFDFQGLSDASVQQCLRDFLIEFGSPSMALPISDSIDYNSLRNRIIDVAKQKAELRVQRKISRKYKFIFQYSADWDAVQVSSLRDILEATFREHHEKNTGQPKREFLMIQVRPQELSSNDFLIDKRPPLRLLTLANNDQIETSTRNTISLLRPNIIQPIFV